ncbi:MAG TPA: glucokinase [Caulobacteraceae bacterium]|nr:glucokinase [Caulobacteraceae bacterium]
MFAANSPVGLVADIGGTNARFALAGRGDDGAIATAFRQDMANAGYASLEASLDAYLESLGAAPHPTMAAFGVASPITGDQVRLTNRDWSFSISGLKRRQGWTRFEVVNDFVAVGHALPALGPNHWRPLEGPPWPHTLPTVVSLVGPGTGFGVGAVVRGRAGTDVIPTEGGHASFAPIDALELEILRLMLARFPRVSNERLLSGPGLEHLYAALGEIRGRPGSAPAAPEIVENGLAGRDSLAVETVQRFCLILGGAMGDVALIQGAGAVAIAGGIAPRLVEVLDTALVRARFEAKGRAQAVLRAIPIALITHPEPGLLGAARLLFAS